MKQKPKSIVKKAAGVLCVAAGAVALMTSKTVLRLVLDGETYWKDKVKKIAYERSGDAISPEPPLQKQKAD